MTKRRAIFLDRDGVLNAALVRQGKPHPPENLAEVRVLPDVTEACDLLRAAGFVLIMVTNQPDVVRRIQSREMVEAINAEICEAVQLDDTRICYHDDVDNCGCRKPKPGLLTDAAHAWNIDLRQSFMVGDRYKDIDAGTRVGCTTILVDHHYDEEFPTHPDARVASLKEAAQWILDHMHMEDEFEVDCGTKS